MPISQYTIPQFIVDAFTDTVLREPSCCLSSDEWLSDNTLQNIAKENNLSETAFTVKMAITTNYVGLLGWRNRFVWPCYLGNGFVLFQFIEEDVESLTFATQSVRTLK